MRPWSYSIRRNFRGEIVCHRTWLKMLANPLLHLLGWQIVSVFVEEKFISYQLVPERERYRRSTGAAGPLCEKENS